MAYVDTLKSVVDFRDQPVLVAFDVEYSPFSYCISAGEGVSNFG